MFIIKNITKAAFALGVILQTGQAMDWDKSCNAQKGVSKGILIIEENLQMAKKLADIAEQRGLLNRNNNPTLGMYTGNNFVEEEFKKKRQENMKVELALNLGEQGIKGQQKKTYDALPIEDQTLLAKVLKNKKFFLCQVGFLNH